jgi:hypothetical protein
VAVRDVDRRRDLYDAQLGPDDERVQLAGWVYYVRAVTWEQDLTRRPAQPVGELLTDTIRLAARGIRRARSRRRPWIVGVVRMGDVSTWNDPTPRVVHRDTSTAAQSHRSRIADLARRARDGEFAPTS